MTYILLLNCALKLVEEILYSLQQMFENQCQLHLMSEDVVGLS